MPPTPSNRSGRSSARSPHAHPFLTERQQLALALKQSAESPASSTAHTSSGGFLRVWMAIALFLVSGTALSVSAHSQRHGLNTLQASLAFFLVLNILICFWEISLGLHITCVHIVPTFPAFVMSCIFTHAVTFTPHSSPCKPLMETIACAAFPTCSFHLCLSRNCCRPNSGPRYGPHTAFTIPATAAEKRECQSRASFLSPLILSF
jgi:hypothetical protein